MYIVGYSKILVVINFSTWLILPLWFLSAILCFRRVPPLNSMISLCWNFIFIFIYCFCHSLLSWILFKKTKNQQNNKNPKQNPCVPKRIPKSQGLWIIVECGTWKNTVCHVLCEDIKHICMLDPLGPNRFSKSD